MSKALKLLFILGRPFSPLYSVLMKSREKFFLRGIFRQQSLPVPVISIGNLVLGGSGKTPTVQHVARLLLNHGYHPAIVSRGYGGKTKKAINIVSDGEHIFLSAEIAGDEPHMQAVSLPGVPVLTGTKRIFPCHHAIDHFNADVILLDDGFQHLAVQRDIDIILFDSTVHAGNSRVFPGGPLREPTSALNRCHAFLLTSETAANRERNKKFSELLQKRFPGRPVFISSQDSYSLHGVNGLVEKETIPGSFLGFCGIANPSRFAKSLLNYGFQLSAFHILKDHAPYNQSIVSQLCKKAAECGAENLVTTEKDYVKLQNFNFNLPLYVFQIHHRVEQSFDHFILDYLNKSSK